MITNGGLDWLALPWLTLLYPQGKQGNTEESPGQPAESASPSFRMLQRNTEEKRGTMAETIRETGKRQTCRHRIAIAGFCG